MEDYTKFRLKSEGQLMELLSGKDNILVASCNKCYKEFSAEEEPECGEFSRIAKRLGKTVVGCESVDFLCNKARTAGILKNERIVGADSIFAISCGIGVQTVADLASLPVYAASDSICLKGHQGMALTKLRCEACGQCYLSHTGGICPIVDCPKSLLNGQCGGAENGKCETDRDIDCAWEKIYERRKGLQLALHGQASSTLQTNLQNKKQGNPDIAHSGCHNSTPSAPRSATAPGLPVMLRDYSKVDYKFVSDYVRLVREKRDEGYCGGLYPHENKERTELKGLIPLKSPRRVVIPLSQHAGTQANPIVRLGDRVKAGQMIGGAAGFISSPVHSSVSGTVAAIKPHRHPTAGKDVLSVVIDSDGRDELHESVRPYSDIGSLSADGIIALVREKGIVGMGGAGFPTSVKLAPPKPIDTVLINGCECEPFLTADHRIMIEYASEVVFGLEALLKATHAGKGIIAIEGNKPDAIRALQGKTADMPNIDVIAVKAKYPQGAEKMLIKRTLGRLVPSGALPLDVGVVVVNVSTAKAISDAILKGLPLIERAVTVSGDKIKKPGNYIIKIGTSVKEIIDHCGGLTDDDAACGDAPRGSGTDDGPASGGIRGDCPAYGNVSVMLGGPMMGIEITSLDVPLIKTTNGIIAIEPPVASETAVAVLPPCIRCGRCVDACPMELLPLYYPQYAKRQDWGSMNEKAVKDCIECGCCDYICPSKIPIREAIRAGKASI